MKFSNLTVRKIRSIMAGSRRYRQNVWNIFDIFPSIDGQYKYIYFVKRWFWNRCVLIIRIYSVVHFFLNFVIFVNRKWLKAISSVKTKILFWNVHIGPGYISFLLHNNLIHKVWVNLTNGRQHKTQGFLGKIKCGINLSRGNECFPKITVTWIRLNYTWLVLLCCSVYPFGLWI